MCKTKFQFVPFELEFKFSLQPAFSSTRKVLTEHIYCGILPYVVYKKFKAARLEYLSGGGTLKCVRSTTSRWEVKYCGRA